MRLLDDLAFRIDAGDKRLSAAFWSLDGSALQWSYSGRLDDCYFPNEGVAIQVPGQPPRVLVRPDHREVVRFDETPDGRYLAFDLEPGEERMPERRGKRLPWPKRIYRDYDVGNRRGNAAVRRVVERAAWRLRHGVSRHVTLIHVRNEFGAIDAPGIDSGGPEEALADTIDEWLLAAGLPGIDARDDVSCS